VIILRIVFSCFQYSVVCRSRKL